MKIDGTKGKAELLRPQLATTTGQQIGKSDKITPIDSTARNGDSVSRRRFQKGSVFLNKTKTLWMGSYQSTFSIPAAWKNVSVNSSFYAR